MSKKKDRRLKEFLRIKPGKEFTALAHSHGMAAAAHGVGFNKIKYLLAKKICEAEGTPTKHMNVEAVLRAKLGLTPTAFAEAAVTRRVPKATNYKIETFEKPKSSLRKIGAPHPDYKKDDGFYQSREWKELRYAAIKLYGAICQCCGARPSDGIVIHVDHIVPRYKAPHLSLVLSNLQVVCGDCNIGKGAWDDTDWRQHWKTL